MKLTLITCACHRPEAWALCEKFIQRQTMQPHQWIVLDDDEPKTECTLGQQYVHNPAWREAGKVSLMQKIRHALEGDMVKGEAVVFIENDDYYAPDYLAIVADRLTNYDMVGEGRALYYNVNRRFWFEHGNMQHASLCQTAIRRAAFREVLNHCRTLPHPFLDDVLWTRSRMKKRMFDPSYGPQRGRRVVGIKGMPGRPGYGNGHRERPPTARDDVNLDQLRKLIGEDAALYEPFFRHSVPKPPTPKPGEKPLTETARVHGPKWSAWLASITGKPDVHGVEIGTFKGDSAEFMLQNVFTHEKSTYTCIDPFTGSTEHKKRGIEFGPVEGEARRRLSVFRNVTILKDYSELALRSFPPSPTFDWAYVDGAHEARNALRDAVLVWDLLKPGGVLCWDDYAWTDKFAPNEEDRPKAGVDAFLAAYKGQYQIIHKEWQVAIRKNP